MLLRALWGTVSLFADAQKFKTKFEECRKEIEEKEKKGAGGRGGAEGGCSADSLCTQPQPPAGAFSVCHRNLRGL